MQTKHIIPAAALSLLAGVNTASAENQAGAIFIQPGIGYINFDDNAHRKLDDTALYNVTIGYNMCKYWGVEGIIGLARAENDYNMRSQSGEHLMLNVVRHFNPNGSFVPVAFAGAGAVLFDDQNGLDRSYPALDLGVGAKWFLNDKVALRLDVRDVYSFGHNEDNHDYVVNFGILFQGYGKKSQPDMHASADDMQVEDLDSYASDMDNNKSEVVANNTPAATEIRYGFNKYGFSKEEQNKVNAWGDYLNQNTTASLEIDAYADGKGDANYNKYLSEKRAEHLKNYLVKNYKIADDRITTKAFGVLHPVADNATDAGREANRRAVLVVTKAPYLPKASS